MKPKWSKIVLLLAIVVLACLFFAFDLQQYFTLTHLKSRQQAFADYYAANQALTIGIYMVVYIAVTALSLPGATVMTLAGGGLFGVWVGLLLVSFASTIGATLAFLVSRFLLRDYFQNKFGDKLKAVNASFKKDGPFYLFTLRLVPIFPFFVINLVMGLTPINAAMFYIVSQVGMLPGTFVYINAGTQLAKIESARGILSPELLLSFALLGIFPLIAKKIVAFIKARKVLARYPRPKRCDYNLVV
ncbi:MAG: TVP38/TMEM64 family protein, partial [Pseudomonadota bacterium]